MKVVYVVTYDLNKSGQDYPSLYAEIKSIGNWCHAMQNLWFVETQKTSREIRQSLQKVLDANDNVFVCRVTTSWDAYMKKDAIDWLQSRI